MNKILLFAACCLAGCHAYAQRGTYDSAAIYIMDRMTDVIGELRSCSFTVSTSVDEMDFDHGLIRLHIEDDVYMSGPDKMLVNTHSGKGHRQYWYNGRQIAFYNHDENNYGVVDAPPTIIEMIHKVNADYGIEFPAADFFYPSFTDDLIAQSETVRYVGKSRIDGVECFHLLASGSKMRVQLWIANDAFNLPVRIVISYLDKPGHAQYEATFSAWKVNPEFPDAMFEFLPPVKASVVRIIARNEN